MLEQILRGGWLMWPLMICSLVGLGVVYDRWLAFRANRRVDTRALRANVMTHLRKKDISGAIAACEGSQGPIAAVLLAGLRSYALLHSKGVNNETLRQVTGQVMEDQRAQVMGLVNKRLDVLTTIGTAAPLLGMTGTVTGMIASFADLAASGGASGGAGVADGIAEALITTAAGLIIALAAVIPQSVYFRWSDEIDLEIEESSGEFVEFILTQHD